jgi:hypothetical protein
MLPEGVELNRCLSWHECHNDILPVDRDYGHISLCSKKKKQEYTLGVVV